VATVCSLGMIRSLSPPASYKLQPLCVLRLPAESIILGLLTYERSYFSVLSVFEIPYLALDRLGDQHMAVMYVERRFSGDTTEFLMI
jgi:hypothetical protein